MKQAVASERQGADVECDRACVSLSASSASSKNKFVHLALQRTLSLALEQHGAGALQNSLSYGLDITIVGDNDFYSQRAQVCCLASRRFHF